MSNPTARPLVHFSDRVAGRDRSLARQYAREAVSRVLKDEHNLIFKLAGAGQSVDAYALNAAVTAAIRSAATRHGQSTGRRVMAEHFAHLGHIVQATLENHADNLPAYEPGERSRLLEEAREGIAEAKREIDHAVEVNQQLAADLTESRETVATLRSERYDLTQAASDERRRLCEEIDSHLALVKELRADLAAQKALREYVESDLLDDGGRLLAVGFTHGYVAGRN